MFIATHTIYTLKALCVILILSHIKISASIADISLSVIITVSRRSCWRCIRVQHLCLTRGVRFLGWVTFTRRLWLAIFITVYTPQKIIHIISCLRKISIMNSYQQAIVHDVKTCQKLHERKILILRWKISLHFICFLFEIFTIICINYYLLPNG